MRTVKSSPTPPMWPFVALGGAAGTAARMVVGALSADWHLWIVNLAGCVFLGFVAASFDMHACSHARAKSHARTDSDAVASSRRTQAWRLFLTTGFAGAFTTYSALSLAAIGSLLREQGDGHGAAELSWSILAGVGQGLAMLVAGLACVATGWWFGQKVGQVWCPFDGRGGGQWR